MNWRPAKSLTTLLNQVNVLSPKRSRASDGLIGDSAHQAVPSDHNPNKLGVVCALDLTHDPKNGVDIHKIARNIAKNPHPNLKYIISSKQIAERQFGFKWRKYSGSNPHTKHAHFSVGVGPDGQSRQPYDNSVKWNIGGAEDMYKGKTAKEWFDIKEDWRAKAEKYRNAWKKVQRELTKCKESHAGVVSKLKDKIVNLVKGA